jgi:hypothetical protein
MILIITPIKNKFVIKFIAKRILLFIMFPAITGLKLEIIKNKTEKEIK